MLWPRTALGIEVCGKQINLALLKRDNSGIRLLKAASGSVPEGVIEDGNIKESEVLAKAIKSLKTKNGIRAHNMALTLVANPILMQILELPPADTGNIRKFVQNEVKHYAVLPGKKVLMDFCGIKSSAKPANRRVLVVAADGQKITEVVKALNRSGLGVDVIEPASLAYIRASYAEKIAQRFDRNLLFGVIHESFLTLCLFKNQSLDFVRTKRFETDGCKSDEYCKWLTEEINAVLRFYESEVLDRGDGWEITLVTDVSSSFIRDKIGLLKSGIEGVELQVRTPEDAYLDTPVADTNHTCRPSAVAVGLAMKLLGSEDCNLNINLLPPEITMAKTTEKHALVFANVTATIFLLLILSIGFVSMRVGKVNRDIERQKGVGPGYSTRKLLDEQMHLNKQISTISGKLDRIKTVLDTDSFLKWGRILNEISLVIPKTIQITKLSSNSNSQLLLEGRALSYEDINRFVDMLSTSENIRSASLVGTKAGPAKSGGLVGYSINCSLIR